MSAQVNANVLKNFIIKTLGSDKLYEKQCADLKISNNEFDEANVDDNDYLDLDEILDNSDVYEQFAVLYEEAKAEKESDIDSEKEKEEQNKVKDKNEAGV